MKRIFKSILLASCLCGVLFTTGCTSQEDIDNAVNPISEQITTINSTLTDLKALDTVLEGKITSLETKVTTLETELETLEASVDTKLNQTKTDLENKINKLLEDIDLLKEKDEELETKINSLEESLETAINDTKSWVETNYVTIDSCEDLENEIKTLITALESRVEALETSVETLEASLSALQEQVDEHEKEIEDLTNRVNCLEGNHKIGDFIYNNDGTHIISCELCNYEDAKDCNYNDSGICDACHSYQPATLTEGKYDIDNNAETTDKVYEISNAGNLYSFMKIVGASQLDTQLNGTQLNAILTNDIVVNENLIDSINGNTLDENNVLAWNTPQNLYSGIFDGNGYTISGLYANEINTVDCGGFLGTVYDDGIIKNLGIIDSYFSYEATKSGTMTYVGGIAGASHGKITNCYFDGFVRAIGDIEGTAGGIVGSSLGEIKNCYNLGSVTASHFAGGLVGALNHEMKNCYNYNPNIMAGEDGGIGGLAGFTYDTVQIYNSYYIDSIENYASNASENHVLENVRSISIAEFASSDFATLLNSDQEDTPWEFIEGNKYPTLKVFNKNN